VADGSGFSDAASFAATGFSVSGEVACALAASFFRKGFACFATLSHNARSSSLKLRLRRGDAGNSRIWIGGGRFIGCRDSV
jgi:hypothetical protein